MSLFYYLITLSGKLKSHLKEAERYKYSVKSNREFDKTISSVSSIYEYTSCIVYEINTNQHLTSARNPGGTQQTNYAVTLRPLKNLREFISAHLLH